MAVPDPLMETMALRAQGISLPSPRAVQQAAAQAGKDAKQAVESAISSATPAAVPKAAKSIGVKLRNPLAPLTAAAAGARGPLPLVWGICMAGRSRKVGTCNSRSAAIGSLVVLHPMACCLQLRRAASLAVALPLRLQRRHLLASASRLVSRRTRQRYLFTHLPSAACAGCAAGRVVSEGVIHDCVQAIGVGAAELLGAVVVSALVGGITARVPSKQELN